MELQASPAETEEPLHKTTATQPFVGEQQTESHCWIKSNAQGRFSGQEEEDNLWSDETKMMCKNTPSTVWSTLVAALCWGIPIHQKKKESKEEEKRKKS